mmetsp:Transcript_94820/g.265513  ORF Transcript_94820/g.265513 Transcript_94820/m.265513 type:complete len:257 (-) Transcript_94820:78-848(-)|eukprot:CAMPEP_0176234180 /NCGR_PEP_ID=MMETSP0121_2-20121125/26203_1 /TAXON_ID=160619 /ORGANISM="Kryptoperidinium foliaceum, Strain CCMP 1326" /LENGTH=256 /DNA_ID=CAMNT_0017573589 /DNA_START=6 /DNA_END=776 /DNA_ORIENTATION=-
MAAAVARCRFGLAAAVVLHLAAAAVAANPVRLTKENFDQHVRGKSVFIWFFTPTCVHCRDMADAWRQLTEAFQGDPHVLIAETDCTSYGKSLCDDHGFIAFPTLMYGDPYDLKEYNSVREFGSLKSFVTATLGPECTPANMHLCDEDFKEAIRRLKAWPKSSLKQVIASMEEAQNKAQKEHKEMMDGLTKLHSEGSKDMKEGRITEEERRSKFLEYQAMFDRSKAKLQKVLDENEERGLDLMKKVLAHRKRERDEL